MTAHENNFPTWEHDILIHGWWVIRGRLLAGEYPGAQTPEKARKKIQTLLDAGIDSFVDLTQANEPTRDGPMLPYDHLLDIRYARFPIRDNSVTDDAGYDAILDYIRSEIDSGRTVYVHCWGGKGRTGTVVGTWLIAQDGIGFPEVLEHMQVLRRGTSKVQHRVPDTDEQVAVLKRRARR